MSPQLARREAALAGVALLAGLVTLAFGRGEGQTSPTPRPVPVTRPTWNVAVASPYRGANGERTTACGIRLTARTRGVAHPVLPCGVKIVLAFGGREIETEVVDRGPHVTGDEFDLTPGLARALGVKGQTRVRWRFAG